MLFLEGNKMKSRTLGALLGLTTLLGCEEAKDLNLGGCDTGGLQFQAIYHQRPAGGYTSLEIYKDGKIVGSIESVHSGDWVQCDDNRKLNVMQGQTIYFSHSPEKK